MSNVNGLGITDLYRWISENPLIGGTLLVLVIFTGGAVFASLAFLTSGYPSVASDLANVAAALATILLVGITGLYAKFTRSMVRESRIERKRDGIILLIQEGLDEIISYLRDDQDKFETETDERVVKFPNFEPIMLAQDMANDLRRQNEVAMEKWSSYKTIRDEYSDEYSEVFTKITRLLEDEFFVDFDDKGYSDYLPPGKSREDLGDGTTSAAFPKMLEKSSSYLLTFILEDPHPDSQDYHAREEIVFQVYREHRDELLSYREHEEVKEHLQDMEMLLQNLIGRHEDVNLEIKKFKKELLEDFEILESSMTDIQRP